MFCQSAYNYTCTYEGGRTKKTSSVSLCKGITFLGAARNTGVIVLLRYAIVQPESEACHGDQVPHDDPHMEQSPAIVTSEG